MVLIEQVLATKKLITFIYTITSIITLQPLCYSNQQKIRHWVHTIGHIQQNSTTSKVCEDELGFYLHNYDTTTVISVILGHLRDCKNYGILMNTVRFYR